MGHKNFTRNNYTQFNIKLLLLLSRARLDVFEGLDEN